MFTLLSKLVRKLTKSERSSLADKLVTIAKQEGQENNQGNRIICEATMFFSSNAGSFSYLTNLMNLALERGTFIGIIVKNTTGEKKMIFGQAQINQNQGAYQLTLYTLGFGSSTQTIGAFSITSIPGQWKTQFEAKEAELLYE